MARGLLQLHTRGTLNVVESLLPGLLAHESSALGGLQGGEPLPAIGGDQADEANHLHVIVIWSDSVDHLNDRQ